MPTLARVLTRDPRDVEVVYIGSGAWNVASASTADVYYVVDIEQPFGLFRCQCKDYENRYRDCLHIQAVQRSLAIR